MFWLMGSFESWRCTVGGMLGGFLAPRLRRPIDVCGQKLSCSLQMAQSGGAQVLAGVGKIERQHPHSVGWSARKPVFRNEGLYDLFSRHVE